MIGCRANTCVTGSLSSPTESDAASAASANATQCRTLELYDCIADGESASVFMSPRSLFGGALRVYTSCLGESALDRLRSAYRSQSESIREKWLSAIGVPPEESGRVRLLLYFETGHKRFEREIDDAAYQMMRQLFNRFDVGALEGVFIGGLVEQIKFRRHATNSSETDSTEECVSLTVLVIFFSKPFLISSFYKLQYDIT